MRLAQLRKVSWLVIPLLVLTAPPLLGQGFPSIPVGFIDTIAGNGVIGFSGDGGPATDASLNFPFGDTGADNVGNIYIPDSSNRRVRRVAAATGLITTIAGSGSGLCSDDDGLLATDANLNFPISVAVEPDGGILVVDLGCNKVRRIDPNTGIITTTAGDGTGAFAGDGGPAVDASLWFPEGVAVDASGDVFIADQGNSVIRKVDADSGIISTIAGTPDTFSFGGDGGPATNAQLSFPTAVAVDNAGNIFIADLGNHRIRRVDAEVGIITTVAGNGIRGFNGDGVPATTATLNLPTGVAVDDLGNLFVADTSNHRIRRIDAISGLISTIAGGTRGSGLWLTAHSLEPGLRST